MDIVVRTSLDTECYPGNYIRHEYFDRNVKVLKPFLVLTHLILEISISRPLYGAMVNTQQLQYRIQYWDHYFYHISWNTISLCAAWMKAQTTIQEALDCMTRWRYNVAVIRKIVCYRQLSASHSPCDLRYSTCGLIKLKFEGLRFDVVIGHVGSPSLFNSSYLFLVPRSIFLCYMDRTQH
jgi:hypothetical protein